MWYSTGWKDPTAGWKYPADVSISLTGANTYVDIWAVRDVTNEFDSSKQNEIRSDNRKVLETFSLIKTKASILALETAKAKVLSTFWLTITETLVAGTPVVITAEAKGTGWVVWKPFKLNNKNGANTVVASITIKAGWSALVLNTNYAIFVWDWTNGDLGYTYVTPLTANALAITADYTYTPNQAIDTVVSMWNIALKRVDIKYTVYESTKTRTYTFVNSVIKSAVTVEFANIWESGDLKWSKLEFETETDVLIHDEIL
jgi:hypothetical protein